MSKCHADAPLYPSSPRSASPLVPTLCVETFKATL
jgi:hypothetical protein